ncbi:hypothetical protein NFJ02_02g74560 [Pycnococcus provasolii]
MLARRTLWKPTQNTSGPQPTSSHRHTIPTISLHILLHTTVCHTVSQIQCHASAAGATTRKLGERRGEDIQGITDTTTTDDSNSTMVVVVSSNFKLRDYNNGRQQQYYGGGGGQQQYQTQAEGAFGYFGPWRESPYTFYNRPTNPAVASGVVSPYYSANAPYAAAGALTKQAVPFGQAVPDMLANNVTTFACGRSIDSCQLLLTKYKERIPCATQFDCTAIDPSSSCLTFSYGVTTPTVPNNPKVQVCVRCCADTVNQFDPSTFMGLRNEFRCTNAAPIKRNLGLQTFNHPFCCANTQAVCGSATTNQFSLGRVSSVSSSVFESGIDGGGMLETRGMDQAAHQRHGVHRSDITGNDVPSNRGGGGRGGRG